MASNDTNCGGSLTPIESAILDSSIKNENDQFTGIPESSSTADLVNHSEEMETEHSDGAPPKKGGLPMGHSSKSSIEVLNNNKQEPIEANKDIMPAIPNMVPAFSHHYIGYHPEKLFKVKEKLHNSEGVAFLPGDKLAVADKHDGHVMIFDAEGNFEKMLVKGVKPCGIAANRSGMVVFTDVKNKKERVVKVYSENGDKMSEFGASFGWKPRGITISNKGLLVVTDIESKNECVGIYTLHGKLMSKFGHKGSGKEHLEEPLYVHVDIKDRILISDRVNNCVKAFDDKGRYLGTIGHHGSGPGCLLNPRGITEDAYGHILICDTGNRRVSAFTHEGHFIKHLLQASDGLQYPVDIAFSRLSGRLAVTMHKANGEFHKLRVYQLPNIESDAIKRIYQQ